MKTSHTPPGLAWNTLTYTPEGIRTLDDCHLSQQTKHAHAWNVNAIYTGTHPAIEITTSSGKHLTGSPNQTVLTIDKKTGQISPTRLSEITKNAHLVGAATNPAPLISTEDDPAAKVETILYPTVTNPVCFTYEQQVKAVAKLIFAKDGHLSLQTRYPVYARQLINVVNMMGCYAEASIEEKSTFLIIFPLSEESVLNKSLMSYYNSPSLYNPVEAVRCCGRITNPHPLSGSLPCPSVLFSDQVCSVEEHHPIPLWDLGLCRNHAAVANGLVLTAPAAN